MDYLMVSHAEAPTLVGNGHFDAM